MTTQNKRRDKTKQERRGEGRRVHDGAKTGGRNARRGRAGQERRDERGMTAGAKGTAREERWKRAEKKKGQILGEREEVEG